MCRWCVVMFILSVVGTAIIYWRPPGFAPMAQAALS
jgi:hypothetical protein